MKTLARAGILFIYSANCCLLKPVVAGLSRGQKRSRNFSESAFRVAGAGLESATFGLYGYMEIFDGGASVYDHKKSLYD